MARKSVTKSKPVTKIRKYQTAGLFSSNANSIYQQVANPYYVSGTYTQEARLEAQKALEEAARFGDYSQTQKIQAEVRRKEEEAAQQKAVNEANQQIAAQNQQEVQQAATDALASGVDLTKTYLKQRAAQKTAEAITNAANATWANAAMQAGTGIAWAPTAAAPTAASVGLNTMPTLATSATGTNFLTAAVPTGAVEVGSQVGQVAAAGTTAGTTAGTAAGIGAGAGASAGGTAANTAANVAGTGTSIGTGLATAGVGLGLNIGGTLLEKSGDDNDFRTFTAKEKNRNLAGSAMKSAGTGVGIGATIGSFVPIPGVGTVVGGLIGGLVGGGIGLIKGAKENKESKRIADEYKQEQERIERERAEYERKRKEAIRRQGRLIANSANRGFIGSRLQGLNTGFGYNTSTNMNTQPTSSFYGKTGGKMYELGGYRVPGGQVVPIGEDAVKFIGRKHSEGGIKLDPRTEVEGGETMDKVMMNGGKPNDYFFSAYLKLGGKSFAKRHEELVKAGAGQAEIQQLAKMQESVANKKGEKDRGPEQIAKYGGIHKYKMAGPEESAMAQSNMDAANVTLRDVNKAAAEAPSDQQSVAPGKRTNFSGMVKQYAPGGPKDDTVSMAEWKAMSKNERYKLIYDLAAKAGDPMPEVTAAQWAIESGFGESMTGTWNAFGQTTRGANFTNLKTSKDPSRGTKNFKNYKSLEDSVVDHVRRWAPKYKNAKDPYEALMMVQNYGGEPRYAEGFPSKEFPKGNWKAYVENTYNIIKQYEPVVKAKPAAQVQSQPLAVPKPLPSGAIQPTFGPIDWGLMGLGQSIARGTGALAGFIGGAARNMMGNATKPTAGGATTGTTANAGPSMAGRGPLRIEAPTSVGPFTGNVGPTNARQWWSSTGPNASQARALLGENVINVTGRTVRPMQALPEFKIGLGNPASKINTQMFRQYDLGPAKAQKAAEFVPTKTTIDPATGQTIEVVEPSTMGPFDVPVVVDEKAIEEAKIAEQKKAEADTAAKKEDAEREKTKPPRDNSLNTALIAGIAQLVPLAFAGKYKTEGNLPRMKSPGKVGAGSVKGAVMPRVNMNAERAAAERSTVAIKNAIQNTNAGPGGIAAMMAANTAQGNQMLAIANQEQNANKQLSAEEARLGQQASQFNVEAGLRAGMANMQSQLAVDQANLEAGIKEAALKIDEKRYKREDKLARLDNFATRAAGIYKDYVAIKAQERLAEAMDDTGGYERFKYYEDLKKQAKNKDSEFYGKTDAELKKYSSQQWLDYVGTAESKTGGVRNRRYTSRLGELSKSKKTFNI